MNLAEINTWLSKPLAKAKQDTSLFLELLILAVVGISFALPFLDMNLNLFLPGRELQVHIGQIQLFSDWLNGISDFPLWNPTVGLGRTWIADPFLFAFNPMASIPMWFWGVNNGSKIAITIHFLIAGFGMWVVAKLLSFRWPTRLWASLIYMMSGGLVAHLQAGQLQLLFALGWLPWSFAGLLWVWQKKSYSAAALASLAQAFFYFSGNLYYQFYAGVCYTTILLVFAVELQPLKINLPRLWKVLFMGILSVGLVSIQFLPFIMARQDIGNQGGYLLEEQEFHGSQKPVNALINYVVSDLEFIVSPVLEKDPHVAESYRYIGISPFIFLFLIVPAFKRSNRKREIVAVALSFLLLLSWAAVKYTFFREIYHNLPFINQFRFPGRALSVGAMFVILLGGFGLEELITWIKSLNADLFIKGGNDEMPKVGIAIRSLIFGVMLVGLVGAIQDVFTSNFRVTEMQAYPMLTSDAGFRWLRTKEKGAYTFGIFASDAINIGRSIDAYQMQFRMMNLSDGWIPAGTKIQLGKYEAITIEPKYWFVWEYDMEEPPNATMIYKLGTLEIWETQTFPFAFIIPIGRLDVEPVKIQPSEVQTVVSYTRLPPNKIQVETDTNEPAVLVVSESWFSGWTIKIDGEYETIGSVSNLLAVPLPIGQHTIKFEYAPLAFRIGAIISLITLIVIVVIVVLNIHKTGAGLRP